MGEINGRTNRDHQAWPRTLSWLPIPLLLGAIPVLWVADLRAVWPCPPLIWLMYYGSVALSVFFIIIPAARTFLANGQPSVLMLGCGVLMSEIGVGVMSTASSRSLDTGFAIYNTSILLSALSQFGGVAMTSRRDRRLKRCATWLTAVYAGGAAAMGLVIWLAFSGRMPVFYTDGEGGTLLRSVVVCAAASFFALTAALLWRANRRTASPFLHWYSLGLALLATGLGGSILIAVWDSPLQWVTRSTQFFGLLYMCFAVLSSAGGIQKLKAPLETEDRESRSRVPWAPVALAAAGIVVLWPCRDQAAWGPSWLLPQLNALLAPLVALLVAALVARSVLAGGRRSMALLGGGMIAYGAASALGGICAATGHLWPGVAVFNLGICVAGAASLAGALSLLAPPAGWRGWPAGRAVWACYGVILSITGALAWAAYAGVIPPFFDEQGPTALRHAVLGITILEFACASAVLLVVSRRARSGFLCWYAFGLALIAMGLAGVSAIRTMGNPLGWGSTLAMFAGLGYLMVAAVRAVLASPRESGVGGIPLAAMAESWQEKDFLAGLRQRTPLGQVLRYGLAVVVVTAAMALRQALTAWVGPGLPAYLTFYPAVMLAALLAGFGPGLLATALAGLSVGYWVLPPVGQFAIASPVNRLGLVIFTGMGFFMSAVAELYQRSRIKAAAYDSEAALRENRARLAVFAEATFEGIVESESGRIVDCNEQLARMLGYSVAALKGKEIAELIPAEDRARVMERIRQGGESALEHALLRRDGTRIVVEVHGRPISPGSARRHTVIRDITERKAAEESLQQQSEELEQQNEELQTQSEEIQTLNAELGHREQMLQTLLVSVRLPIGEQDVLEKVCRAAREMVGPGADSVVVCEQRDGELHILAHAGLDGAGVPSSWPSRGSFVEMMIGQDRTASLEDASLRPDLRTLSIPGHPQFAAVLASPLHVNGKPIGGVSIYSRTPQQWTAEQFRLIEWLAAQCSNTLEAMRLAAEVFQSHRQNELLANVLESSSQAFGMGYPDGRLGLVNRAFEELTGYSREELQAIDWARMLTPPEWVEIERQKLDELHRSGRPVRYEKEYIRKDGSRVPIELLVHLAKDDEGNPHHYSSFITDITERKKAEEALKASEQGYRGLFENMMDGFAHCQMLYDDNQRPVDFVYLVVNNSFERLTGLKDVVGKRVTEAIPNIREAHAELFETYGRVARTGNPERFEIDFKPLAKWLSVAVYSTQRGHFTAIFEDITERKHAEEALRDSEERLRIALEAADLGTWDLDLATGIVVRSLRHDQIFGYQELQPEWTTEIAERHVLPEDLPITHKARARAIESGELSLEARVRWPDGSIHWINSRGRAQYDSEGRKVRVIGIVADITERKRAENVLQTTLQRFYTVLSGMYSGILLVTDGGRVEFTNQAFCDRFGLKDAPADLVGLSSRDMIGKIKNGYLHPDQAVARIREILDRGQPVKSEEVAMRDGGICLRDFIPLKVDGGSYGRLWLHFDITERKRAEEALRESEERYRSLFSTLMEGFCIIEVIFDPHNKPVDYRFLETNPAFEAQTGLKNAQGRLMRDLAPDHEAHWFELYGKVALTGEPARFVNEAKALDRWFDVSAYRVGGPESRKVAILFSDITQRMRAEQSLRDLNVSLEKRVAERAAETQRLAGQLRALASDLSQTEQRERKRLATILHDHIQQLLVAAQLQLGLIKRADSKTMESTVQGVESIVKEAIDASRSLTVELSPPILHQAGLAAGLGWLANRMGEKHLFKVRVQADHDAAPANEGMRFLLFESVRELLLNAVKHSGVQEARVAMARTPEGWTKIVVEDEGRGFDPAGVRERQVSGGSFGLFSIQQRLVHLGGRLEIESASGRGTRVVLLAPPDQDALPVPPLQAAAPATAGPEAVNLGEKGARISVLLVDDHKIMRQGLASILQFEDDIEVVAEAEDGRQAVELARRHKPDVVIMDVNMPVMDGIQATGIIARELPQIKVVGLSMHSDPDVADAMRKAGAVGYLTKGGPFEDLIAAIRACSVRRNTEV